MMNINYIKEYIEKSIKENWDQPAFTDYQGKTYTYQEVAQQIHRLHKILGIWGVNQGDKISLIGRNNSSWAITYLATISYGAVIVPILADFSPDDIHHIVSERPRVGPHVDDAAFFTDALLFYPLSVPFYRYK